MNYIEKYEEIIDGVIEVKVVLRMYEKPLKYYGMCENAFFEDGELDTLVNILINRLDYIESLSSKTISRLESGELDKHSGEHYTICRRLDAMLGCSIGDVKYFNDDIDFNYFMTAYSLLHHLRMNIVLSMLRDIEKN